jgi:dihydrofolate synthase / folylpolyglutamate synthase
MQFDEALRYLLSLGSETLTIKLGLRNTELLLDALGNPQKYYPSVQIAGTNGKGSTAVLLDSICNAAGIKTGLYTSPHLISITERIKFNQQKISESEFARAATVVRNAAEELVSEKKIEALPTFFEHITAIAFWAFKEARIDLAILETGLGGRLDATSVAEADVVGITPIALDHEEYLGKTIDSIAAEKAAIIRPGVSVVVAPQLPKAVEVIVRQAIHSNVQPNLADCDVTLEKITGDGRCEVTFETPHDRYPNILIGLRGRHQIVNVSVAIRLAESLIAKGFTIPHAAFKEGIESARHPGRLDFWPGSPSLLFDGAHNASGTEMLREYLESFIDGPITLVFGVMRDKSIDEMAANLFPIAQQLVLTRPDNPRSATLEVLQQAANSLVDSEKISSADTVRGAIALARSVTPPNGVICFAGSLYLIGEAQSVLQQLNVSGAAH